LGHENRGYGPASSPTTITINQKNKNHPILKGLPTTPWISHGNIYLVNPLAPDKSTKTLLNGSSSVHEEPVAFTRQVGKSKIFYTTLGYPTDFSSPPFVQLLTNAIDWALK
jgi:type 1 glutamine amidotransferase